MMGVLQRTAKRVRQIARRERDLEQVLINQGAMLSKDFAGLQLRELCDAEFRVFSQWGEDGIIQYLISNLNLTNRNFIEFGVETFYEANCRFLLMNNLWKGYVIDGSADNVDYIRRSYFYWKYPLEAKQAFITKENIVSLVNESGFANNLGVLSIDIDGVDWFVLEALAGMRPEILIVEYNGLFGKEAAVSVTYDPAFQRSKAHPSNLYYGASLAAFDLLARRMEMSLVGGNRAGNNAFFVRNDLLNELVHPASVQEVWKPTAFAEGRDASGALTFIRGDRRRDMIADMPLEDLSTGRSILVRDLP